MSVRVLRDGQVTVLVDTEHVGADSDRVTDDAWWRRLAGGEPLVGGRGGVRVTDIGAGQWVLRHYRRGGLVGRVVHDRYLWTGLERTRAFAEWRLLHTLTNRGLPVPAPVAARVERRGPTYRADLVTVRLPGAVSLSTRLTATPSQAVPWAAVGATLRRFHDAGVCHADLNAHNILLDDGAAVYLLDFDRGRLRGPGAWHQDNLRRLRRSLDKIGAQAGRAIYEPDDWAALTGSYSSA